MAVPDIRWVVAIFSGERSTVTAAGLGRGTHAHLRLPLRQQRCVKNGRRAINELNTHQANRDLRVTEEIDFGNLPHQADEKEIEVGHIPTRAQRQAPGAIAVG